MQSGDTPGQRVTRSRSGRKNSKQELKDALLAYANGQYLHLSDYNERDSAYLRRHIKAYKAAVDQYQKDHSINNMCGGVSKRSSLPPRMVFSDEEDVLDISSSSSSCSSCSISSMECDPVEEVKEETSLREARAQLEAERAEIRASRAQLETRAQVYERLRRNAQELIENPLIRNLALVSPSPPRDRSPVNDFSEAIAEEEDAETFDEGRSVVLPTPEPIQMVDEEESIHRSSSSSSSSSSSDEEEKEPQLLPRQQAMAQARREFSLKQDCLKLKAKCYSLKQHVSDRDLKIHNLQVQLEQCSLDLQSSQTLASEADQRQLVSTALCYVSSCVCDVCVDVTGRLVDGRPLVEGLAIPFYDHLVTHSDMARELYNSVVEWQHDHRKENGQATTLFSNQECQTNPFAEEDSVDSDGFGKPSVMCLLENGRWALQASKAERERLSKEVERLQEELLSEKEGCARMQAYLKGLLAKQGGLQTEKARADDLQIRIRGLEYLLVRAFCKCKACKKDLLAAHRRKRPCQTEVRQQMITSMQSALQTVVDLGHQGSRIGFVHGVIPNMKMGKHARKKAARRALRDKQSSPH